MKFIVVAKMLLFTHTRLLSSHIVHAIRVNNFSELCNAHDLRRQGVSQLIAPLTDAFIETCQEQRSEGRNATDFFGLRDFYR